MRLATLFIRLAASLALIAAPGCAKKRAATATVAPPQPGVTRYESPSGEFTLQYPSEWTSKPAKDCTLRLERESNPDSAQVTVDVPAIPPHLPGMMTMGLVVNGYLDDQKKRLSDFNLAEQCDDSLAGSKARRLVMTGREWAGDRHGQTRVLAALISIRNEQVYILQADATQESFEAARQAMAEVADGWVWTR